MTQEFWSTRPVLQHVLTLARARGAGPWAVLGSALARAVATIPPVITLPGIVGGRMSLNVFIALVGPSGGGKGAAEAAVFDGFRFTPVPFVPLGTGEGLARTFRPIGTQPGEPNPITAAIFTSPEIDTFAAPTARHGSTISAEVRKVYSGEQLGFGNAGKDARNIVEAGSYRACLTVGVQPLRSDAILGAADGGLPQRFVWLPTSDPDAPDDPTTDPTVWKVSRPSWNSAADLIVPDQATSAIRAHRRAVLREDPSVDPLDGHALLTRLKVAVALMALDGRTVVSDEDWTLAGSVMDVSDRTRQRCQRALADQSRSANTARALAAADRDEIVSDRKQQRARHAILRRLERHRQQTKNQLRMGLKADIRDYLNPAISELLDSREITVSAGKFCLPQGHMSPRDMAEKPAPSCTDAVCPTGTYVPSPADMAKRRQTRERQRTRGKYHAGQQTQSESA